MENEATVTVTVPTVPSDANVYRSWRKILTGLDDGAKGSAAVLGPEVGHGAVVETAAGALVLVVDQHITGWGETYLTGKRYPRMDAAVSLHLVEDDGALKQVWARHFKTAGGAFGSAGLGQLRKHLAARPPAAELSLTVVDPGPGRPSYQPGPCCWCGDVLPTGSGVLVGRGPQVEHRKACPSEPAAPGTCCARCGESVAPMTARLTVVREGKGRREVLHTGRCEDHPSLEQYERQVAAAEEERAAERAAEKKREEKRAAAAEKRSAARAAKKKAVQEAAAATKARVESLPVVAEAGRTVLYDKGLSPYGDRLRLVEVTVTLSDGAPATWWEVTEHGGHQEAAGGRGGVFYLLDEARYEYQSHKYQPGTYEPYRRQRLTPLACPEDGSRHCGHCGSHAPDPAGWMIASFGLACTVDCYTHMANDPGDHDRQFHGSRS
ncbi:hypothetical protein [Streptomyces sp. NPDC047315]|uniref:hypothetical protein n=1 Tax=Streptomyces sp. NPDC047315 TaxID=3155142 RepID=UPI0033E91D74